MACFGVAGFFLAAGANLETMATADHYSCFAAAVMYLHHVGHMHHLVALKFDPYARLPMAKAAGCPGGDDV